MVIRSMVILYGNMVILSEDGVDDKNVVNGDDSNQSCFGGAGFSLSLL